VGGVETGRSSSPLAERFHGESLKGRQFNNNAEETIGERKKIFPAHALDRDPTPGRAITIAQ
jgi:hypothetical protein